MSSVIQDHGRWTKSPPQEEKSPLPPDGGGGDNGGMDGRLARLEKRVDSIDGRLDRIEGDVASLRKDVSDVKVAIASLDAKLDIGSIRASVEKSHTDIYKWVATLALSLIGVGAAVYFGIQRISPTVQPAQPPVIYVQPAPHQAPLPSADH
ncbi:hypothetical protein G5B41_17625 [bacterium SGD-2]|nr:hypothetical protein [bacterium SGD-2]